MEEILLSSLFIDTLLLLYYVVSVFPIPSLDPLVVIEVKTIRGEDFLEIFPEVEKNYPITFRLHIASHEWYTVTPAWLEQWERGRDIFNDFTISQRPVHTLLSSGKRAQDFQ